MLKVLIVDDEPIIREGLKTLIDWNRHGFCICGEAVNGRDGLKKYSELEPDLVVADIKMPGMDGLQMIEQLIKMDVECRFIILTGYSDFKYAQKAIEFGVDSYILKPIDETELIEKLDRIHHFIMNRKKVNECFNESIVMSRDSVVEGLITGDLNLKLKESGQDLWGFGFPWRSYQIMLADINAGDGMNIKEKCSIKGIIDTYMNENAYGYVFSVNQYIGVLLKDSPFVSCKKPLETLQKVIKNITGFDITLSIGMQVNELSEISLSYKSAFELIKKKFLYGAQAIICNTCEALPSNIITGLENINLGFYSEKLYTAIDVSNKASISQLLDEISGSLVKSECSEEDIKVFYLNLYVAVTNKLILANDNLHDLLTTNEPVFSEVHSKICLEELRDYFKGRLVRISDYLGNSRPDGIMKRILDYIYRNYNTDIKLETLAEVFNYNSAYLGKLFKSYTGECFNTYLDKIRIEKAKQFLKEGFKVYQVAERIGYNNIDYFHSKFKKYAGVSPSAYKTKYQA